MNDPCASQHRMIQTHCSQHGFHVTQICVCYMLHVTCYMCLLHAGGCASAHVPCLTHVTYLIIIAVTGLTHLTLYLDVTWYMVHSGTLYRIGRIIHGFENLIILTFSRQYTYYIWFILGKYYWIAPSGLQTL